MVKSARLRDDGEVGRVAYDIGGQNDKLSLFYGTGNEHTIGSHHHNTHEIIFIEDGRADFTVNDRHFTACTGDVVFISDLEQHSIQIQSAVYKRYWILIPQSRLNQLYGAPQTVSIFTHRPDRFQYCFPLKEDEYRRTLELFGGLMQEYEQQKELWEFSALSMINVFLIRFYRHHREAFPVTSKDRTSQLIYEIQNFLVGHCCEEINLDSVAEKFFVSKYYLCRLFHQETGYTLKKFIILQRLAVAREMLLHSGLPVTEISASCGFGNVSHFTRSFTARFHISPLQYRKKYG